MDATHRARSAWQTEDIGHPAASFLHEAQPRVDLTVSVCAAGGIEQNEALALCTKAFVPVECLHHKQRGITRYQRSKGRAR